MLGGALPDRGPGGTGSHLDAKSSCNKGKIELPLIQQESN